MDEIVIGIEIEIEIEIRIGIGIVIVIGIGIVTNQTASVFMYLSIEDSTKQVSS
jgi:serine acetyltransferase